MKDYFGAAPQTNYFARAEAKHDQISPVQTVYSGTAPSCPDEIRATFNKAMRAYDKPISKVTVKRYILK